MDLLSLFESMRDLANLSTRDPLIELYENRELPSVSIRKSLKNNVISRHGDMIVGFVARQDIEFTIKIGDNIFGKYTLQKNQFIYVMIPLICLVFHDVIVSDYYGLDVIYAIIRDPERMFLARNKWYYKIDDTKYILYKSAMSYIMDSKPEEGFEIPMLK